MKTTIDDIFKAIAENNPSRLPFTSPQHTDVFQHFINDNRDDPEALMEALELFIKDKNLPIDNAQYNFLLNQAAKHLALKLLTEVPFGLDRILIDIIKNGTKTHIIDESFIKNGAMLNAHVKDGDNKTALYYALLPDKPDLKLIELLLQHSRPSDVMGQLLETAIEYTLNQDKPEARKLLLNAYQIEYASTQEGLSSAGSDLAIIAEEDEECEMQNKTMAYPSLIKNSFFYTEPENLTFPEPMKRFVK